MPQNIRVWFHSGYPVYLYLSAKLAEQGCVCAGGAEPSSEGAAECGVHDSGACRARIHHSPAAAYHAQPYRDWAAYLRPALHQLGVPEGKAVLILLTNNCHHSSRQRFFFLVWHAKKMITKIKCTDIFLTNESKMRKFWRNKIQSELKKLCIKAGQFGSDPVRSNLVVQ